MTDDLLAYAKSMHWTDPPLIAHLAELNPPPQSIRTQPLVDSEGLVIGTAVVTRHAKHNPTMHVVATIEGRRFHGTTPTFSGTYCRLRPYRPTKKES